MRQGHRDHLQAVHTETQIVIKDNRAMTRWAAVLIALIAVALSAGIAEAGTAKRQFKGSDYPLEVRRRLSFGPVTCREVEGGGNVGFARNTVRKVDFNGDGRLDYIVSFEDTTCGGAKTGGF